MLKARTIPALADHHGAMNDSNLRGWVEPTGPEPTVEQHWLRCLDDLNRIEAAAQALAHGPGLQVTGRGIARDTSGNPVPDERRRQSILEVIALVRHARQQLLGIAARERGNQ